MEPKKRRDLALMVPEGGQVIELGVAAGAFAVEMLTANPNARYLGIDRWSDHHDESERMTAIDRLRSFRHAQTLTSTFSAAVPHVEDESVDLVYVDGYAHTGQDNGRTLAEWWPKVRPGGIFAGHDYDPTHYPQTVAAVNSFVETRRLWDALRVIDELPHPSWWLVKP